MSEKEVLEKNEKKRTICEIWSRVMGYYRPRSQYNKGKTQESLDRKCFKVSKEQVCKCEDK